MSGLGLSWPRLSSDSITGAVKWPGCALWAWTEMTFNSHRFARWQNVIRSDTFY